MSRNITCKIASSALAIALLGGPLFAQNQVDIGLFQDPKGRLEVKLRPQSDMDGILSSLVFTIRWDRQTGATLGQGTQVQGPAQFIPTSRAGAVRESGPYLYQVFSGVGFQSLASTGTSWQANHEYTILTIPVEGTAQFELVNDAWTHELTNNGDLYVSVGGADRTGVIYKNLASPASLENSVLIQPNPNDGQFTFSFVATENSDIQVEVLNTLGQRVFTDQLRDFQGSYRKEMDLTSMSNGIYYLKISRGGENSVHKIVYR